MKVQVIFTNFLIFFVSFLGLFSQVALGAPAPVELEKRDVYDPPVLYPHNGTVWYSGQRHNVTWYVETPHLNVTNHYGQIMLRKGNLTTPLILASEFDLFDGRVEVTVPWVLPADDYRVVVFGDSGNWSPTFTIIGNSMFTW
ncbi:hypothetical protein A0H81_10914 [Grifola frondosa]|uniref:Yeast cell wall synthesis Kre9/Knh1-like N-terminal domain-containing protein n=1 Tax=Grifola frondosa TaxID=5627 RepID=A0A1C7LWS1_GRIFR|nr:hypothetical protein A0H81_10914 [Grifola frondosa]